MKQLAPLQSPVLGKMEGLKHGFFTREGGVSKGIYAGLNVGVGSDDNPHHVTENRNRVADWFGKTADHLFAPWQVHSPDVAVVREARAWPLEARPKADAVVTNLPDIILGIVTADCGPVLFCDPKARVIGAAHAGWGGAVKGVLENTVAAMESIGASRSNITASLGPSIAQENYEVGPEFFDRLIDLDPANAAFFAASTPEKPAHHRFDLKAYSIRRLMAAGVKAENFGGCTYADEEKFYSFRRTTHKSEPDYGRQISAISLQY